MAQHGYIDDKHGTSFDPDYDERERGSAGRQDRGLRGDRDRWSERHRGTSGYGREHGVGGFQGDYRGGRDQGGFGGAGDYRQGRRSFSSHPDDHYLSWRGKQLEALDRDYEEYCREREQQFHQDFDSWRRSRQPQSGGSPRTTQADSASSGSDELLLERDTSGVTTQAPQEPQTTVDAESSGTLGSTQGTRTSGRR